jgi:transmembrane sensor
MTPPVNKIEQTAAEWAAKLDAGAVPAEVQSAFEAWIAADPRHLGAYLKVEAVLARVSRLGEEAQRLRRSPEILSFEAARRRRRFVMAGAIAACLAIVVTGGVAWKATAFDAAYETGIGEMRTVALPDGSSVTLNTTTRARVHYSLWVRDVVLDKGEALFNVAKHKTRPFTVEAAGFVTRAVGTSFAITNIEQQPFTVTVREGVVAVSGARITGTTMVAAGSRAVARFGMLEVGPSQLKQDLAWLDGRLVFRRQTLAVAAREFARYSSIQIVTDDPAIANRTITGTYEANDPVGFAKAVAVFMDLQLETVGAKLYLRQKNA